MPDPAVPEKKFVWGHTQPYFFSGTAGSGIGGPHAGMGQIWPMSQIMYALTSESDEEIVWALGALKNSSAGTGLLHESFNQNNVQDFTRPWFAWSVHGSSSGVHAGSHAPPSGCSRAPVLVS